MKALYIASVCLLLAQGLAAQQKPSIRLVSNDVIYTTPNPPFGLLSFRIHVVLHGRAAADQTLSLVLRNYDAPLTSPLLSPQSKSITIPKTAFSKLGLDTPATVICTISLNPLDSLVVPEKAFLVKVGEEDNPLTIVIRSPKAKEKPKDMVKPAAKNDPAIAAEAGKQDIASKSGTPATSMTTETSATSATSTTPAPAATSGASTTTAGDAKKYTVSIVGSDTHINPSIGQDAGTKIYPIKIHFKANGDPGKDTIQVPLGLIQLNASAVNPVLQSKSVTIQPDDWTHKDSTNSITKTVNVQLNTVKTFENDVNFFIIQPGDTGNIAEVDVTTIGMYNPNKPFWVEVGANFDFADGLKANNFFGGVFFHKRDIRPIFYKKSDTVRAKRLGIFAGVFESKTISDVSTDDYSSIKYYDDRSTRLVRGDSVGAFVDTGKVKRTQVVKNIGLFFSPQVRLTNGSANGDGLHVAASLWLELQWQTINSSIDYTGATRADTFYVPRAALDSTVRRLPHGTSQDIRSHYFGFGLPIYFKEGDANVYFYPVIGFSNQPSATALKNFTDSTSRQWRPFYIFQFRLNEEHFGITFTGEVRGLLIHNSKPFVSLALTKKFDLSKFLEFK